MKRLASKLALMFLALVLAACGGNNIDSGVDSGVSAALRSRVLAFNNAMENRDKAEVKSFYSASFAAHYGEQSTVVQSYMNVLGITVIDHSAMMTLIDSGIDFWLGFDSLTIVNNEFKVLSHTEGVAQVQVTNTLTLTSGPDSIPSTASQRMTWQLEGDTWRIISDQVTVFLGMV